VRRRRPRAGDGHALAHARGRRVLSLVVVGDALLDRDLDGRAERLAPDAPVPVVDAIQERARPGGAGLAAALAAAGGAQVTLVCALGADDAGRRLGRLLADARVRVCDLGLRGATPEKVRVRAGGRPLLRLDSGDGTGCGPLSAAARRALSHASAVLVSDYGRGVAAEPSVRAGLEALSAPIVWDPHPNGPYPVPGVLLATPNAREAGAGDAPAGAEAAARALAARWRAVNVCVTRGALGALLVSGDGPALAVPAPQVAVGDPCGAGDAFAAAAAERLAAGAQPSDAVRAAVRAASAFVFAGGAAAADLSPQPPMPADAAALAARVHAQGGTVVATGGCFDLLHAGHVRMLEAARALGDCLIVCLNSDASVRRLKGPDRPLVGQDDRAAVLAALGSVDAVAVFEEDDPRTILRDLRPDVWAKGGDYAVDGLPEAEVLAEWGARAVILPYVSGRSTTRLIEVARVA
jgi:D-beta-D-heptose 7-phosphate kinase/D-beta-D-heptose 1-phosphate adenosyltransferase